MSHREACSTQHQYVTMGELIGKEGRVSATFSVARGAINCWLQCDENGHRYTVPVAHSTQHPIGAVKLDLLPVHGQGPSKTLLATPHPHQGWDVSLTTADGSSPMEHREVKALSLPLCMTADGVQPYRITSAEIVPLWKMRAVAQASAPAEDGVVLRRVGSGGWGAGR